MVDIEAARQSPQLNDRMGNTGDCLWECRQLSSTQNEPYGRGEINRSRMVSLSREDKKCLRDNKKSVTNYFFILLLLLIIIKLR